MKKIDFMGEKYVVTNKTPCDKKELTDMLLGGNRFLYKDMVFHFCEDCGDSPFVRSVYKNNLWHHDEFKGKEWNSIDACFLLERRTKFDEMSVGYVVLARDLSGNVYSISKTDSSFFVSFDIEECITMHGVDRTFLANLEIVTDSIPVSTPF